MPEYRIEDIRNVVLLSHSGAGKTSLAEALLYNSGAITRLGKVDEGNTTSDYDPDEIRRGSSVNLSLLPLEWKEKKINIIDTPGYADFLSEVQAALRVADGAVIVICAASGVEVGTDQVWSYIAEAGLPCLIFVNKIDREHADFHKTVEQIKARFGRQCLPLQLPIGSRDNFGGVVQLLAKEPAPESLAKEVETFRDKLVEVVVETNDELINRYLEGEELTEDELRSGLRDGVVSADIVPILVGTALGNKGISELLDAISEYLPSSQDRGQVRAWDSNAKEEIALDPDEQGPVCALVFKTTADPYVGRLTYFRVYSGAIHSDSTVWNASKGKTERIGQLYLLRGKAQEAVAKVSAGDIGAVAKLSETGSNDSLSSQARPLTLAPISAPSPSLSLAVHPKTKADVDKMGTALARLIEEDHSLSVRKDPDTGETILSGLGEAHLEVAAERMKRKLGVEVDLQLPKIPYKETITVATKAEYKHKKQTGGHGQYGHVRLELEPLPRGQKAEFTERVVGGSVPKNYIPAVEKGVHEALQEGVVAGYPVVNLRVILYDGSYHPVDSSEISFKIAAAHALRKGLSQGQSVLLEPIMNMRITVPEEFTGLVQVRPIGKQDGATITSTKLVSYRPMLLRARGIFHEDGSFEAGYLSEDDQGRVYANRDHDNETNPGLSWKPDSQFVEFTAAAVPVDPDMPDSFRVQWSAEDPDDPTNNPGGWNGRPEMADGPGQVVDPNDYDVNGVYDSAEGNDNTGSADDHPTWGQASDLIGEYPISLVSGTGYDDRHAVVHTAFLSGSSKVRFNLTDDGGDNFKVSAVLMDENVPLAESQVAAETGVFTVWKLVDLENVRMNSADDLPLNDVMNAFAGYAFVQFDLDLTRSVENVSPMGFTLAEATVREGDYCSNQEEFTKQFLPGWFFIAGALARVPTSSIEIHAGQATISGELAMGTSIMSGPHSAAFKTFSRRASGMRINAIRPTLLATRL